ncbi:vegetative cell wall protein gp1-like [Portunus trituberculatus]|uniref:vegetative cell wall protein gp1-like n=1 Tax=Portunus trituberculatus TaxID=210409 RepID=UPI001E1CFF84|nr:vegetative cell wall protein gp1-like [Portunus trituberculatus]
MVLKWLRTQTSGFSPPKSPHPSPPHPRTSPAFSPHTKNFQDIPSPFTPLQDLLNLSSPHHDFPNLFSPHQALPSHPQPLLPHPKNSLNSHPHTFTSKTSPASPLYPRRFLIFLPHQDLPQSSPVSPLYPRTFPTSLSHTRISSIFPNLSSSSPGVPQSSLPTSGLPQPFLFTTGSPYNSPASPLYPRTSPTSLSHKRTSGSLPQLSCQAFPFHSRTSPNLSSSPIELQKHSPHPGSSPHPNLSSHPRNTATPASSPHLEYPSRSLSHPNSSPITTLPPPAIRPLPHLLKQVANHTPATLAMHPSLPSPFASPLGRK